MTMNLDLIQKTKDFLEETFHSSDYLRSNPRERSYRLEHSYRVANLAKTIALQEGLDVTYAVIAGLLHDIAYCEAMPTKEDRRNHGRIGAAIARPFLCSLGLSPEAVNDICFSIAIHVDDRADFDWTRSAFSETVGDADNIDRFDVYRIYETLQFVKFDEMSLEEKKTHVSSTLEKLIRLQEMPLGTSTAKTLWLQRLDYYIGFYEKLNAQLLRSNCVE